MRDYILLKFSIRVTSVKPDKISLGEIGQYMQEILDGKLIQWNKNIIGTSTSWIKTDSNLTKDIH